MPRSMVPVPERYRADGEEWVDVEEVLEREDRSQVFWFEIAALCEALLASRGPVDHAMADIRFEVIETPKQLESGEDE